MPKLFGKRSGFESVRDILIFLVGVAGIIPQIYHIAKGGAANIGTLMFFGTFLAAPQVINQASRRNRRDDDEEE